MSELTHTGAGRARPAPLFLWIGLLLVGLASSVRAAKDYSVETIPNVRLSDRSNHVSNPDGIIAPDDAARINQLLDAVEDSLGIEVAVVAVNSIGDRDARTFATDLFKHWGLGQKDRDNGLLIQLVTEPSQRSVVFETGYGIEGVLPDAVCYRIQQRYMMPDLKAGDYSAGLLKGVLAVSRHLMSGDYERMTGGDRASSSSEDDFMWIFLAGLVGMVGFSAFVAYLRYRPRACPRCGKKSFAYRGRRVIRAATRFSEGLAEEVYRCKSCGHTEKRNRVIDRVHRGGGGPIIMGGGGFGGFGGGGGGSWGGGSSGGGGSISRF
ncbi:YgcG family protein [Parabacteroides sp. ZJ-118]|uniref:TPM domain-containing protein n=1 Tax=Parabacteroides sp. ZJ-118 TaxID=2709398 RepID=UPI0013ED3275|nr:TPM domain-containing protein [Parabacteroides sp. ZJ-118]